MKRAMLTLGLAAVVATPAAAQWLGEPVWNSPKGGTGVTISGDYAKPNSDYGKGNTWGGRASLGIARSPSRQAWRAGSPTSPPKASRPSVGTRRSG